MQNLLKKIQLAELAGVSRAHVTQACRPGGAFHEAVVGQRVDAGHPIIVDWLAKRDEAKTSSTPTAKKSPSKPTKASKKSAKKSPKKASPTTSREVTGHQDSGTSKDAEALGSLTLDEVRLRFGGEPQFSNWLKDINLIETIRERRLKNEEAEGSLIQRSLVETHILGLFEETNQRLLTDLPKTLARSIRAHALSDTPLEESEKEVRKTLGQTLDATKGKVTRRLRQSRKK